MKQFLTLILITAFFSACAVHETYVVRERPREVVYVRPPAPGPQHVWVSGDWVWEGGGYRWMKVAGNADMKVWPGMTGTGKQLHTAINGCRDFGDDLISLFMETAC